MQPPPLPAYSAPPPPVKRGVPVWVWAVVGGGCLFMVAVIAILAAILFPVFAQAREEARKKGVNPIFVPSTWRS